MANALEERPRRREVTLALEQGGEVVEARTCIGALDGDRARPHSMS
jgi:hypothetical protein